MSNRETALGVLGGGRVQLATLQHGGLYFLAAILVFVVVVVGATLLLTRRRSKTYVHTKDWVPGDEEETYLREQQQQTEVGGDLLEPSAPGHDAWEQHHDEAVRQHEGWQAGDPLPGDDDSADHASEAPPSS